MRVLIVEDNAFNAFCLRRLLESAVSPVTVSIVNSSKAALLLINNHSPDMVVIDGDLGTSEYNGPELLDVLLKKYSDLPVIAWSDSDAMKEAFARVLSQNDKQMNEYNTWTKIVSRERICKTWAFYFGEFINRQHSAFSNRPTVGFCSQSGR